MLQTDVAVIGAGPVGLFSVFECGMLNLTCHVIDSLDCIGGQCSALYPEKPIYDIPGHPCVTGEQLISNLKQQIDPFQPVYHLGQQVLELTKTSDTRWILTTSRGVKISARSVIIAAGVGAFGPNRPPLKDIESYEGTCVFYAIHSKEKFKNKSIVIAGGGDSAVDWAIALEGIAKKISVVHRRAKFRAAPESESRLKSLAQAGRIDLVTPYQLHGLQGDGQNLRIVEVIDLSNQVKHIEADILLPFFGLSMNLGPIMQWGLSLDKNNIVVDPLTAETNIPGIYAIGDIATYENKLKLILSGFAESAQAAHSIKRYLYPHEIVHFEYSTTKGVPTSRA